jgi:hypothetical protein
VCRTVNFKLFDTHRVPHDQIRTLLAHHGTAAVVLERDVHDEECSLRWAQQTGDFGITPMRHAIHASAINGSYEAFKRSCNGTSDFAAAHHNWFSGIRATLREVQQPWLELRFEEVEVPAFNELNLVPASGRCFGGT